MIAADGKHSFCEPLKCIYTSNGNVLCTVGGGGDPAWVGADEKKIIIIISTAKKNLIKS